MVPGFSVKRFFSLIKRKSTQNFIKLPITLLFWNERRVNVWAENLPKISRRFLLSRKREIFCPKT